MRILAILLALFLLVSCHSSQTVVSTDVALYLNCRIYKPLLISTQMSQEFPRIHAQMLRAIEEWEDVVPVDFHVRYGFAGPWGTILLNYKIPPEEAVEAAVYYLGLYNSNDPSIIINKKMEGDTEKFTDQVIFETCMHELGHALGLPHIIAQKPDGTYSSGKGRDIVLPTIKEAKQCIMFPTISGETDGRLKAIEILWAHHALMHDPNLGVLPDGCVLRRPDVL